MITVEEVRDVVVGGNFQTKAFTIKADSKAFSILSDRVYTQKVRAVIREISCNAYDSHVDAKNPAPFDVHLPTYLESWFSVRDYGTGISHEQMFGLYTEFFTSTRNNSNEYVGNLGIGRFSALSISDSFTIISFYNGIKSSYSCFKDANGEPQIALLSQEATDEPNGLLVSLSIPSNIRYEFDYESVNVFKYFDKQPNINIKGVVDQIKAVKYLIETKDFSLNSDYGNLKAVMGNVSYDIDGLMNPNYLSGIIRFDIGDLNFDPGREKLSMDARTKKNVQDKINKMMGDLPTIIKGMIKAEPTDFKRNLKYNELCKGNFGDIIRKSKTLSKYELPSCKTLLKYFKKSGKSVISNGGHIIYLNNSEYYLRKEGFTARIRQYIKESKNGPTVYLLTQYQIDELKIDKEFIKDLSDLPKVVRDRSTTKVKGDDVRMLNKNGRIDKCDTIPDGPKIYVKISNQELVYTGSEWCRDLYNLNNNLTKINKILTNNVPQIYVVKTAYTKRTRFAKEGWVSLPEYVRKEVAKLIQGGCIVYNGLYEDVINKVYLSNKDGFSGHPIEEFYNKSKQKKKMGVCSVLKEIGYYDPARTDMSMDILEESILEENPIFNLVDLGSFRYNDNKAKVKIVADYILQEKSLEYLVNQSCEV